MLKVAVPPLRVPLPIDLPESKNVTVPVAALGVIVAVNVTELPYVEGLGLDVSVSVVGLVTVCVSVEDLLLL
jgi:hypothetical protein